MKIFRFLCLLVACTVLQNWVSAQITGGMLDPAVDSPSQPFSYFWHPTDIVGTLYAPVASEVTPEGYVWTGFGELMFFVGNPPQPVSQRTKTLRKDFLPIIDYQFDRDGVVYQFSVFASELPGLEGLPLNFIRVQVTNRSREPRAAFLTSAYRFSPPLERLNGTPDYRFRQSITRKDHDLELQLIPAALAEGQYPFNPEWKYDFAPNALLRDGRLVYTFPENPKPDQVSLSLGDSGLSMRRYFTGEVGGNSDRKLVLSSEVPMGVVMYRLALPPGGSQTLVFKMPVVPLPSDSAEARAVQTADCEQHLAKVTHFWEEMIGKSTLLKFPESKVQNFLLANTVFDLLAIDKVGEHYYMNVNKFQYHDPYGAGNTSDMLMGLDYMGMQDIARKPLLYFKTVQYPDGSFHMARHPEANYWEIFGYTLWCWGRHYLLTHDKDFLAEVYPGVVKAMEWQKQVSSKDEMGLMPRSEIADDAFLKDARQTGMHMWVLVGLKHAVRMAEAMGNQADAERFTSQFKTFWSAFEKQLNTQTAKTGGYIPPALERTTEGNDWDNMLTLYPDPLFDPFDPRVTATLKKIRGEYVEGVLDFVYPRAMTRTQWPGQAANAGANAPTAEGYTFDGKQSLHYWQFPDNAQNHLVRGSAEDQELAVKDMYALLLHTTSTHAPQEFGTYPWSTRDYEGASTNDILPDGAASGKMIQLLRNMLVREYKRDLYLCSALSPEWLKPGKVIEVHREPTEFGPINFRLEAGSQGWAVKLSNQFWEAPAQVLLRVPWFYEVQQVTVDGRSAQVTAGHIVVPTGATQIEVQGRIKPGTPRMSYEQAVDDYKAEYRKRYAKFLETGVTGP